MLSSKQISEYLDSDFKIFPLAEGTKFPAISKEEGGHGCLDATDDPEIIADWQRKHPKANIGIACGEKSDLIVIDIDVKGTVNGYRTLELLQNDGLILPPTCEVETPSGGKHYYYRYNEKISKNSAGLLGPGIDIRSNGGYVAAPPSQTADGIYKFTRSLDLIRPLPRQLAYLMDAKQTPREPFVYDGSGSAGRLCHWVSSGREGERNSRLFWAACRMGEDADVRDTRALEKAGLSLGLTKQEVQKTIAQGLKYGGG